MHKKFFCVFAGLLCLTAVLHLVEGTANGQGAGPQFVAISEGTGTYGQHDDVAGTLAITASGEVYFRSFIGPGPIGPWQHESSLGAAGVVAMSAGRGQDGTGGTRVFLNNGSVYFRRDSRGAAWTYDSYIGASGVMAVDYGPGSSGYAGDLALTANGDVYLRPDAFPQNNTWRLDGNILGGATGLAKSTWGAVKARYRN